MRFTISQQSFTTLINTVATTVPAKPTLPVLANVLLRAEGALLRATGTNMEQTILSSAECVVKTEGATLVNAKRLQSLVREMPDGEIAVSLSGNVLTIEYPNGSASVMTMDSADYPDIADDFEGTAVPLGSPTWLELVDKGGFCTASDRTRLALTGALLEISADELSLTSTDGHRLAHVSAKSEEINDGEAVAAIIPAETLSYAARLASNMSLSAVKIGNGVIRFDFDGAVLRSKLIDGPYPNWRQVMPKEHTQSFTTSTDDLARAVKRTGVVAHAITRKLELAFDLTGATLSTENQDIGGRSKETVDGTYVGEPFAIGMNASYLREILGKIDSDSVTLEMSGHMAACIIRPYKHGDVSEFALLMPLRLSE